MKLLTSILVAGSTSFIAYDNMKSTQDNAIRVIETKESFDDAVVGSYVIPQQMVFLENFYSKLENFHSKLEKFHSNLAKLYSIQEKFHSNLKKFKSTYLLWNDRSPVEAIIESNKKLSSRKLF